MVSAIAVFGNHSNNSNPSERIEGSVSFHQCSPDTKCKVKIELRGFKEDILRGIHIHKWGDMREGCTSACEHFNPYGERHGSFILHGKNRHVGDLINNIQSTKGKVYVEYYDDMINLFAIPDYNIIGRMVVIHASADNLGLDRDTDKESATTGKAGKRIACSPIVLYGEKCH